MLKAKLFSLQFVEPMVAYLNSIKAINNQLVVLSKPTLNEDLVMTIIHALPKDYNNFFSNISCNNTLSTLTFNELEELLLQEKEIYMCHNEGAFTTKHRGKQPMMHKAKLSKEIWQP